MNRLNEFRTKAGHPLTRHDTVLRAVRGAREKLGPQIAARNFVDGSYIDANGQHRPLIQFSQDVILNVCTAIGGPVEHQLIHQANVELNRLKKSERTGGAFDTAAIAAAVASVIGPVLKQTMTSLLQHIPARSDSPYVVHPEVKFGLPFWPTPRMAYDSRWAGVPAQRVGYSGHPELAHRRKRREADEAKEPRRPVGIRRGEGAPRPRGSVLRREQPRTNSISKFRA